MLEQAIKAELEGDIFEEGRNKELFVGRPFYLDYETASILISDAWKNKVKGIPQGTFLLAFYDGEKDVKEAILLRALTPSKLPTDNQIVSTMIEYYKEGTDISGFGGRDRGRNHSIAEIGMSGTAKSRSPHSRLGLRSNSPHTGSGQDLSKFTLKDGRVLDMNNAYRRLSDGNLALAGGALAAALGRKTRGRRANSGDSITPNENRLQKDYTPMEGEDVIIDSSDDEVHSSDEDRQRGRKNGSSDAENKVMESKTLGMGRAKGPRTARSLMAAAEEERQYTLMLVITF